MGDNEGTNDNVHFGKPPNATTFTTRTRMKLTAKHHF